MVFARRSWSTFGLVLITPHRNHAHIRTCVDVPSSCLTAGGLTDSFSRRVFIVDPLGVQRSPTPRISNPSKLGYKDNHRVSSIRMMITLEDGSPHRHHLLFLLVRTMNVPPLPFTVTASYPFRADVFPRTLTFWPQSSQVRASAGVTLTVGARSRAATTNSFFITQSPCREHRGPGWRG